MKPLTFDQFKSLQPGQTILFDSLVGISERVFLGMDPMQASCAMVRPPSDVNATIQVVHYSNLALPEPKPVEHTVEMFINMIGPRTYCMVISEWKDTRGLSNELNKKNTRKVIDARATEDGLLLVKYINEPLDERTVLAAHANPVTTFN